MLPEHGSIFLGVITVLLFEISGADHSSLTHKKKMHGQSGYYLNLSLNQTKELRIKRK